MATSRPVTVPLTLRRREPLPRSKVAWFGVGAVLFALAVALPLFRQTGTRSWHTVWAEDGSVYYQQARQFGVFAVMFRGYNGYLQLPPRILGGIATLIPTRQLPLYFALSAEIVNALLAWFVYWASEGWIRSRAARLALASMLVLLPALGTENTATITNTVWTFMAAAPWAIVSMQEQRRGVAVRSTVAFFAATATALSLIFVPVALGYAVLRKTRAGWIVASSFLVGVAIQAVASLHTSDASRPGQLRQVSKLPDDISVRVFAQYAVGDRGIRAVWGQRTLVSIVAPLVVLAILAFLLRRADRRHQLLSLTFLVLAVVTFVVPVWGRGTNIAAVLTLRDIGGLFGSQSASTAYQAADRFSVVPVIMLASSVAVVLEGSERNNNTTLSRVIVAVFVAQIAIVSLIGFSVTNTRSAEPNWSAAVDSVYRTQCLHANPSKRVSVDTEVRLHFYPVTLTCHDLAP